MAQTMEELLHDEAVEDAWEVIAEIASMQTFDEDQWLIEESLKW